MMVVPSLAESFPYVVLEAAAAGLPLISTNVGGIPEIVADTDTALIVPGSVAALTAALRRDAGRPRLRPAPRPLRLRANVERKFTVAGMTERRARRSTPVTRSLTISVNQFAIR